MIVRNTYFRAMVCVAALVAMAFSSCDESESRVNSELLDEYESALADYPNALRLVETRVDSLLGAEAKTVDDSLRLFAEIATAYTDLSLDSAVAWYGRISDLALVVENDSAYRRSQIEKSGLLMSKGLAAEATMLYKSLSSDSLRGIDFVRYHAVGQQIAIVLYDSAAGDYSASYFSEVSREHSQALMKAVPDTSVAFEFAYASLCKVNRKESKQLPALLSILSRVDASRKSKGIAAFWLGVYYIRNEGLESPHAGDFLLRSAIEELRAGRQSGMALGTLGQWFYDTGDKDRGMKAWRLAVDNSSASGSANQWIRNQDLASTTFSIIDNTRHRSWLTIALLSMMLAVCVVMTIVAWRARSRQRRLRKEMERRLMEMTYSKRSFVTEFMRLFSLYMEGIEEQHRMICRKIAAGNTDELLRSLKTGKFIAEQGKIMYEGFDNAFLNVFPTFVGELNALLDPEKRFEIGESRVLNPELRVMALQRLGIDDGQRIARFLGLSVNTVYAYRNKVRSRVVDRETFDEEFMRIGTRLLG